jgi:Cys-rich repeat protein
MNTCGMDGCTSDSECPEGEVCHIDPNKPVCDCVNCPCAIPHGTCGPPEPDGSCESDADCGEGQTCTFYYPSCPPPPEDFDVPPDYCAPIGMCESGCRPTGCAGTVCAAEDIATTCEWQDHYMCYKLAICDYGPDGACGWQKTEDFVSCMEQYAP